MKNGAIDLSQAGAELKFKIDPITGEAKFFSAVFLFVDRAWDSAGKTI